MAENENTQVNQSTFSSAQSELETSDSGTAMMSAPPYSLSGISPPPDENTSTSLVDVPIPEFNYNESLGICENPMMSGGEQSMMSHAPEGNVSPQPDARAAISGLDPANLSENTFANLIYGILGGNGSSAEMTLEIGLGVGTSIGIAEAFGGIKLKLGGKAEIATDGKFKLEGLLGFGGYLRAEAAWVFEAAVQRMGNIKMEGEFDNVTHFSQYVHNRIVNAAKGILREMRAHVSDRYIPATLISLADSPAGRVRGPEVTTSTETETTASVAVGNEAGGADWTFGHTSADYEKERDGRTTDRGSQVVFQGGHGIRIGQNEGRVEFKHTTTDSSMNDGNDKQEFELKIGVSGVANRIDETGSQRLIDLVSRTGDSVNALATISAQAGRAIVSLISGGSIYTGSPTVPDLDIGARGSLNLVFKFEKTTGNFNMKSAAVNFGYSMNFATNAQFPIPGTGLMGEGSADFTAQFVRNIFYINM